MIGCREEASAVLLLWTHIVARIGCFLFTRPSHIIIYTVSGGNKLSPFESAGFLLGVAQKHWPLAGRMDGCNIHKPKRFWIFLCHSRSSKTLRFHGSSRGFARPRKKMVIFFACVMGVCFDRLADIGQVKKLIKFGLKKRVPRTPPRPFQLWLFSTSLAMAESQSLR